MVGRNHRYKLKGINMTIPLLGLGTWRLKGAECEKVVQQALELGYRHIDTADLYENHEVIGKVIQSWPRQELFLATKLFLQDLTPDKVEETAARFLKELQVDYLDLLLIHWPNPDVDLAKTLQAMLDLKEKGMIRAIGLSNFVRFHLEALDSYHFPILTNQIEMHPYLQRRLLVDACKKRGIQVTAYRPLAKGAFESDPTLQKIGKQHGKSPSQVALRWLVQQTIAAIPKAATLQHLKDNIDVFDFTLTDEEMGQIDTLDQGKRFCTPDGMPIYED